MAAKARAGGSHRHHFPLPAYLGVLAFAIAAALTVTLIARRSEVDYRLPHRFGVHDATFFASAHALSDPVPIGGNKVQILRNGAQIFPAMLEAIGAAEKTINFEAYIFWSGEVGGKFRDAFIERARHGVKVRVLLDGLGSGSKLNNSDVRMMRDAGCVVEYYHPLLSWRLDRINRRSHRRVAVIDGRIAFTGSVGFADEWLGNADAPNHWRETQLRLEGPLVAKLQSVFQAHWAKVRREPLSGQDDFPGLAPAGNVLAQTVASYSYSVAATPLLYAVAISSAEKSIAISNAYFVPDKDSAELLIEAARRGVDVRVIIPGKNNDVPATKAGGRGALGGLLRAGVKIFEYQPTMFHPKTMVVDGIFCTAGSTNFDARSFRVNEELDATFYDENFAREMTAMFEEDLRSSKPYTYEQWARRSWWERSEEVLAGPFRSQL